MSDNITALLYFIPALVIAISFHEMMHGVVGYWLGDDTAKLHGRLSLNPLRHIDPLTTIGLPLILVLMGLPPFAAAKPVPINFYRLKYHEFGMALVGIAGPLTNLFLALVFGLLLRLMPGGVAGEFLYANVAINIGLFVFNLIPFPPLDGSRVLYAFAPESVQNVMMQIERMGFMAILLFMFIGFRFIAPGIQVINSWFLHYIAGA